MIYRIVTSPGVRTDDREEAIRILAIRQTRKRLKSGKLRVVEYTVLDPDEDTLCVEATVAHERAQDPRSVHARFEVHVSK